ncbi:MAG TPA: NUDIX domain-containing protein [Candidatus Limnocylindrales bacterium]|nr:NUDIX domain-containing protein [Candidatus Limnocylindrales bacterium]
MHETDELLDLVDEQDQVVGTILRSEFYRLESERLGFIRGIEFLIENDNGQLWIPTRTANKKIAPNALDYSCGGHVSAGESYIESGLREIKEELNLDLRENDLDFVHLFDPTSGLPYFRALYRYCSNSAPQFNTDDFVSAEWLSPEEISEQIANGKPAKSSLAETIKYYTTWQRAQGKEHTPHNID